MNKRQRARSWPTGNKKQDITKVVMQKVTLQFTTETDLRRFFQQVHDAEMEVNFNTMILVCCCDEAEVQIAINSFNATIIATQKFTS